MKHTTLFALLLLITSCATQNKPIEPNNPEVYGSIRMGVEGGKVTNNNSRIGIKNY